MHTHSLFCFLFALVFCFGFAACKTQTPLPSQEEFSLCQDGHELTEIELLPPTCTEDGTAAHLVCSRCGQLFDLSGKRISLEALVLPASHTPDGVWSFDESRHFQTCRVCGEDLSVGAHSFSDGICKVCGAEKEETTCKHEGGAATCLEKAICEKCGKPYGRLAAHQKVKTVSDEFLASEATCTRRASYHFSCALCGFLYAETFTAGEPLGHEGIATCLERAVCTRCGETFGSLGEHDFSLEIASDETLAAVATCSSGATYYKTCSVCGKVGNETFTFGDATGDHRFAVDYSASDNDSHTLVCELCGARRTNAHVGHSTSCLTPTPCTVCGIHFIPPDAHRFTLENPLPQYLATPATAESPATYYYSCEVCGKAGTKTFSYGDPAD